MIKFDANIQINRPIEVVFQFVVKNENMPLWNSAVQIVNKTSTGPVGVGTTYWMARNLPQGRAENTYEIIEYTPPTHFSIKILSGPTPFVYRYHFEPVETGTRLSLDAEVETPATGGLFAPILSRAIKRGVEANFATLKHLLETTSHVS
jgi:uncharacterized protein YndB with AHSA1/START domain